MGDIKKRRKNYSRPKKLWDKERIEIENKLVEKYGLKNKREIWKAKAKISRLRNIAKKLIPQSSEEKEEFYARLNKIGLNVKDISDVLALTEENWLDRRLQTFVFNKGLANTPKHARQLIVHKHVLVNGEVVNIPSFMVGIDMENNLKLIEKKIVKKKETEPNNEPVEEVKNEDDEVKEETQ